MSLGKAEILSETELAGRRGTKHKAVWCFGCLHTFSNRRSDRPLYDYVHYIPSPHLNDIAYSGSRHCQLRNQACERCPCLPDP